MISAAVLTHNDEKNIENTLRSLAWCNRIIVIDDNSRDETEKIVRIYTKFFFQRALHDDFSAQRNFGLSKAPYGWVLFVDSDEQVSTELRDEILHAITDTRYAGYYVKRTDRVFGRVLRYGETATGTFLRLAKKGYGSWIRPVHEVWNSTGNTRTLSNPLHHYPRKDVAQFISEINFYSTLNAKYFYTTGKRVRLWQIIAYPAAKFFLNYFIRKGFLDGIQGMMLALSMSFHSFLTRGKMWELQQQKRHTKRL